MPNHKTYTLPSSVCYLLINNWVQLGSITALVTAVNLRKKRAKDCGGRQNDDGSHRSCKFRNAISDTSACQGPLQEKPQPCDCA